MDQLEIRLTSDPQQSGGVPDRRVPGLLAGHVEPVQLGRGSDEVVRGARRSAEGLHPEEVHARREERTDGEVGYGKNCRVELNRTADVAYIESHCIGIYRWDRY